nr:hypothetical protein DA06_28270 [Georgenia sp. SUBG003]
MWDGELGEEIKGAITEETGFELLGNMFRGSRNLTTNSEVTSLEDLEGLTIRTPSTQTMVETWQTLGARAEAMPWDEVYSALEQGVIDGQENPLDVAAFNALYEVQSHVTLTEHMYANYPSSRGATPWPSSPRRTRRSSARRRTRSARRTPSAPSPTWRSTARRSRRRA